MKDQVSLLLEKRGRVSEPWALALAAALLLHVGVAAAVVMVPTGSRRALHLPSVQVRLAAPVVAAPVRATPAPAPQRPAPRVDRDVTATKPKPEPSQPPAQKSTSRKVVPAATPAPTEAPGGAGDGGTGVRSPSGAVGLGGGSDAPTGESFPYTYYLNRFLGMIESNWYRPPAPPGTHCRVLCRIDRSGRLVEAGIEERSATPAFDRAALRAVYASAPFPPLPQGFGGSTLTMHLEFGP